MPHEIKTIQLDLLTIGDCSIDLFMKVPDEAVGISNEPANICFTHGSKIMVEGFQTSISGNSVNVASGTSLLGIKTGIYSETGDDQNAKRIKNELDGRNVDTSLLMQNANTDTALHSVIVYKGERTIFSYHGNRKYSLKTWDKPKFIYYTSLGAGFEEFQEELTKYLKDNHDIGLVFNPGTFQMASGVNSLKNILSCTDLLILNKEEAMKLTNVQNANNSDLQHLHKELQKLGVKLSVITDGKYGATAYDGNKLFAQEPYSDNRPVIDMTGAGDAFSAGFIAAIIYGKSLEEALKWGVVNSGCQIKAIGAVEGMLDLKDLQSRL